MFLMTMHLVKFIIDTNGNVEMLDIIVSPIPEEVLRDILESSVREGKIPSGIRLIGHITGEGNRIKISTFPMDVVGEVEMIEEGKEAETEG